MKIILALLLLTTTLFTSCGNDKKSTTATTTEDNKTEDRKVNNPHVQPTTANLEAPDFSNPELKKFYADYTSYINRVVTLIQQNDEAGALKLFKEEGKNFNKLNKMEEKAKAEEESVFNAWLMSSVKYQQIIIGSAVYRKFNEDYYKEVGEKFKKNEN